MNQTFLALEEVLQHELFIQTDIWLKAGRHIGLEDGPIYDFIHDAMDWLEPFYRRYGVELIHQVDGYFYLLPLGRKLPSQHLNAAQMLTGQLMALAYLEPHHTAEGGVVAIEDLLMNLQSMFELESLYFALFPRKKRFIQTRAHAKIRQAVTGAIHTLASLGFIDILRPRTHVRLRPALLRFVEPVRVADEPIEALERLIQSGQITTDANMSTEEE